jgi:hypothetical protein
LRFEGDKFGLAVRRTILGSPEDYAEFMALKKKIEVPDPVKKAKSQGLGLTPKSLLGHANIPNSHNS